MKNFFKRTLRTLAGIGIFAAVCVVFGVAIMLLWNWLLPPLFGLSTINYLQAVGLLVLARILFGGIGGGFGDKRIGHGRHISDDDPRLSNPFREKWLNMSDEEREDFWKHHHHSFR
jgi:hypothetical protein